ncbi:MAG: hypothetical protein RBS55_00945 [Bacteroidales bacterium]|nr:hypothetical protein [Bacteroidales bacterium]
MKRGILYMLFFFILAGNSFPQVRVQVVSREINKTIAWEEGMSLVVNGDNAEIYCSPGFHKDIGISMTIISKHEERTVAEADLEKMKWLVEVNDNACFVRNYIELSRNQAPPGSAMKVVIRITVPANCPVSIHNYFGKTEISGFNSGVNVSSEYGPVILSDLKGNTTVNSIFGDINIKGTLGHTRITSTHSQIILSLNTPDQYGFNLELTDSEIIKPEEMIIIYDKKEKGKITGQIKGQSSGPEISIIVENCSLTIEQSNN